MPSGIKSAPEVLQKRVNPMFEVLEGVMSYIDEILIWGETQEEHNKRLQAVLKRDQEANLKFNKEKCRFSVGSI